MTRDDVVDDFVLNFSQTASTLFAGGDVHSTLQQVVDLAAVTIEGCDFAGIFFRSGGTISTWVHTDPRVEEIDALQRDLGDGPCISAIAEQNTFYAADLTDDPRWPEFGRQAIRLGIRSVLSLHLTAHEDRGALNLYAKYPDAFGVIDRGKGVILAALSALAIALAQDHEDEERRVNNLTGALESREIIGQAQGILMERERITGLEAFEVLRRASQHLNRKLRAVAQDLVDTGENPDAKTQPSR